MANKADTKVLFDRNAIVRFKRISQMPDSSGRTHLKTLLKEHSKRLFEVMRRLKAPPGSSHPQRLVVRRIGVRPTRQFYVLEDRGHPLALNGFWFEPVLP